MKKLTNGARLFYGLLWVVFGLNFFFHFLPMTSTPPEAAMKYMSGLMAAPYFFPLLKVTEVVVGVLLLLNIAVPLALVVISPIVVHILLYHTVLDPSGASVALLMTALNLFLGIAYWNSFKSLFRWECIRKFQKGLTKKQCHVLAKSMSYPANEERATLFCQQELD